MNQINRTTPSASAPTSCPTCGSRVTCDCAAWRTVFLLTNATAELLRKLCPSTEVRHA